MNKLGQIKNINDFLISENSSLYAAIRLLNISSNKCLCVVNSKKKFIGTISDGDIRKVILKNNSLAQKIKLFYNKKPYWIYENFSDQKKINYLFLKQKIDVLPVLTKSRSIKEILTRDDFMKFSTKNFIDCSVVIMAGGKGKRLLPYTLIKPKPLLSINGQAMILRLIEKFSKQEFNSFFLTLNYKKNLVKEFINKKTFFNKDELSINFIDEKKPLGTIGSLSLIDKKQLSDPFIVTNCDTLINHNFNDFIEFHKKNRYELTVITAKKKFIIPFGNIESKKNIVIKIQEKPEYILNLNVGFYIINKKCLGILRKNTYCDATTFINRLIDSKHKIGFFEIDFENWTEIGRIKEFNQYNQLSVNNL